MLIVEFQGFMNQGFNCGLSGLYRHYRFHHDNDECYNQRALRYTKKKSACTDELCSTCTEMCEEVIPR